MGVFNIAQTLFCSADKNHCRKVSFACVQPSSNGIFKMQPRAKTGFAIVCSTAAAVLIAGTMSLLMAAPAGATPEFANQTGKPCGQCHVSPAGGALNPYGEKFKANGHKLPK